MANKTKKPIDISNFKKQRNYVVNLNEQAKLFIKQAKNISVLIALLTANCFG